jgi:TonB family protein
VGRSLRFGFLILALDASLWAQSASAERPETVPAQEAQPNQPTPVPARPPNQQSAAPKSTSYVLEPVTIFNVPYPQVAREKKIEGKISAQIAVSERGDVESVRVFEGDALLAHAAEEAIKQWKFKPVVKDGKAIPVLSLVALNFLLSSDDENSKGVPPEIAPARDFPLRVRVSEGVSQKLILNKVNPIYPPQARADGTQGTVLLHVIIGVDGTIIDLQPISGPPSLVPAASYAVRRWRFRPYLLNGHPVEVDTQIQILFTLSRF